MMCGLLAPDAGQVFIHGKPVGGGDAALRSRVGVCPQELVLWERLTCLEQLQFIGQMYGLAGAEAKRRSLHLLDKLGLADRRNKQARTLSGGMQRRLNLAMALVHDPEIVVLDEPEAGLDPQSRVRVREYIQSLARRKTVILTTHNMDEADRLADRVAVIDHGCLLVLGTPQALKKQVGAGDVVEIELRVAAPASDPRLLDTALADLVSAAHLDDKGQTLTIRALNAVGALSTILERLESYRPGEVRVRENTLEDVFIQLTGRRLRE